MDYVSVSASKGSINQVNKTVNRLPSRNSPETYEVEIQNCTFCTITGIEFFVNNSSVLSRDIFVGKGFTDAQCKYYEFVLDEAQNPSFQLSLVKQDTLVKTTINRFFNDGWDWNSFNVGNETVVVDGKSYVWKVMMYKGWFFGNWIKVEYFHNAMSAGN